MKKSLNVFLMFMLCCVVTAQSFQQPNDINGLSADDVAKLCAIALSYQHNGDIAVHDLKVVYLSKERRWKAVVRSEVSLPGFVSHETGVCYVSGKKADMKIKSSFSLKAEKRP
ncbi:hypothetical protein [Deinococcus roseus]|uniref:Uncharacterized protein n=1 Tax=Deinococcus roseus TaxID=392414 RepID=A0ABQ2DD58_9DEIO|nr:hypothetical protein [Deinococcus roseus]GGJ53554.1 hypothetical protein GCM10008938_44480 [Deinococcus roseus]